MTTPTTNNARTPEELEAFIRESGDGDSRELSDYDVFEISASACLQQTLDRDKLGKLYDKLVLLSPGRSRTGAADRNLGVIAARAGRAKEAVRYASDFLENGMPEISSVISWEAEKVCAPEHRQKFIEILRASAATGNFRAKSCYFYARVRPFGPFGRLLMILYSVAMMFRVLPVAIRHKYDDDPRLR